jgi:hypothetical protein
MISLKNVLQINALSSGVTGAALVIFGDTIAKVFGVSETQAFWGVGISLVAFAVLVFKESKHEHVRQNYVKFIIALDLLWIVASLIIVVLQLFGISMIGHVAITAVASWVGLMAYLQMTELRKVSA